MDQKNDSNILHEFTAPYDCVVISKEKYDELTAIDILKENQVMVRCDLHGRVIYSYEVVALAEALREFVSMHKTRLLPSRFTYLKGKDALALYAQLRSANLKEE